jgi:hypothetical protein
MQPFRGRLYYRLGGIKRPRVWRWEGRSFVELTEQEITELEAAQKAVGEYMETDAFRAEKWGRLPTGFEIFQVPSKTFRIGPDSSGLELAVEKEPGPQGVLKLVLIETNLGRRRTTLLNLDRQWKFVSASEYQEMRAGIDFP